MDSGVALLAGGQVAEGEGGPIRAGRRARPRQGRAVGADGRILEGGRAVLGPIVGIEESDGTIEQVAPVPGRLHHWLGGITVVVPHEIATATVLVDRVARKGVQLSESVAKRLPSSQHGEGFLSKGPLSFHPVDGVRGIGVLEPAVRVLDGVPVEDLDNVVTASLWDRACGKAHGRHTTTLVNPCCQAARTRPRWSPAPTISRMCCSMRSQSYMTWCQVIRTTR